mmetsp:Transcript_8742/g.19427  ORF Transcript_8742/g.19427 Transcript_8742/m.19427 type:complete len:118 (+) Transcript_8742:112-465(+)
MASASSALLRAPCISHFCSWQLAAGSWHHIPCTLHLAPRTHPSTSQSSRAQLRLRANAFASHNLGDEGIERQAAKWGERLRCQQWALGRHTHRRGAVSLAARYIVTVRLAILAEQVT